MHPMRSFLSVVFIYVLSSSLAISQSRVYIPGGLDFASRVLGNYSLPVRTLGFEGPLRNPANYGSGMTIQRMSFESSQRGIFNPWPEVNDTEEILLGGAFEFDTVKARMVLGFFIDNGVEGVLYNNVHPKCFNFVVGLSFAWHPFNWCEANFGFVKYFPSDWARDFEASRIDYGAQLEFLDHFGINFVYRNVTSYSVHLNPVPGAPPLIAFPDEILSSSWIIFHRIAGLQLSLLGKLYANPGDIDGYTPLLHVGYNIYDIFGWQSKSGITTEGVAELFVGSEDRITFGINIVGWGLQVGKNKYGTSYNLIMLVAWLGGLK